MANVKISQLPSLSTMTDSAIIPVVASSTTQQISGANLKTYFSSVSGNITASYFLGNGSQLTGLPASYSNANVAVFMANYGSNTISTTGNITVGNVSVTGGSLTWANSSIVQTSSVDLSITGDGQVTVRSLDGTYQWTFDTNGVLTAPGNIGTTGNISATGNSVALAGTFRNGDGQTSYTKPQITFGYENTTQYPQWIHTRHSAGVTYNNAIDFYTSDGTQNGTFPTNAILGGSVTQGAFKLAVYANATVRDSTITSPQPGMMIYVTGTGMQVRGATSWNTIAGSGT